MSEYKVARAVKPEVEVCTSGVKGRTTAREADSNEQDSFF